MAVVTVTAGSTMLADSAIEINAARTALWECADQIDAGLDPRGIRGARDAIRDLAAQGTAVVLSSHQLDLVEAMADRLLVLSSGRAVFSGTLEELREARGAASLEEVFLALTDGRSEAP